MDEREVKIDGSEEINNDLKMVTHNLSEARSAIIQPPQQTGLPRHLGGASESNDHIQREVSTEEAEKFARENDLIWLGETSLKNSKSNAM